ncbi:hypothetical protein D7V97_31835 [Corallococcus sp. CA053C]|nr:hypothetical protein D7V97_31835 [Corallococcus sp. CA053C]
MCSSASRKFEEDPVQQLLDALAPDLRQGLQDGPSQDLGRRATPELTHAGVGQLHDVRGAPQDGDGVGGRLARQPVARLGGAQAGVSFLELSEEERPVEDAGEGLHHCGAPR